MGVAHSLLPSVVSTLGGLVFGYELGIISGALLQLQVEFKLTCFQQEFVVSALLLGALLASLVGGILIDSYGRRKAVLFSNLLILGGSLMLSLSGSLIPLVFGRITVGFAISISSISCCIFISEMVAPHRRGMLVSLYETGITVGILVAYSMNYCFSDFKRGWRYMFGLAIIPSVIQLICILLLPSSPTGCKKVDLERPIQSGLVELNRMDEQENGNAVQHYSFLYLFQKKDNMRTRMLIGLGLVLFQQFTGQPNVLFYASTIFHSVGFHSDASAVLASVGLGVVKVFATLFAMSCADRVGRRVLLLLGCTVMSLSVIFIGILSHSASLQQNGTKCTQFGNLSVNETSRLFPSTNQTLALSSGLHLKMHRNISISAVSNASAFEMSLTTSELQSASQAMPVKPLTLKPQIFSQTIEHNIFNWLVLISLMAFVSAFSIGFGPMTWLVLSEIFPAAVRGRAFAFANCFNWTANLIVTLTFLDVVGYVGLSWIFLLYGLIGLVAVLFIYFLLPETKEKSLEEIDMELSRKKLYGGESFLRLLSRNKVSTEGYERVQLSSALDNE
ncbi:solute carrier family 2, facilitated glucose transporter member 10 [Polypterus senegalus]|nr:solute carrier family 2, facilitated glucose transporter member 10 [Polypterus senegalus]XP_039591261.1 solute carrier family 2, facilitated glucose transporter member 10 [Polypterus senegalus]